MHDQLVRGDLAALHGAVDLLLGSVLEHHGDGRTAHLLEAGGTLELVDPALQVGDLLVVDGLAQGVDVPVELGDLVLQVVGPLALLPDDGVEVGHAGGPQVQSAGVEPARDEQGTGHHEHGDGDETPDTPLSMPVRAQRGACSLVAEA